MGFWDTWRPQINRKGQIMLRIGTDIGGTFTDIAIVDDESGEVTHRKVLTSAANPAEAVIQALDDVGIDMSEASMFSHGTTIAINAIIQQNGAKTGVIATRGFRDTLEMRRGSRTHMLDPLMDKPTLFVPRDLRLEVSERVHADGTVEQALDEHEFVSTVQSLVDEGVEAIAIMFMHSYAHPEHEKLAGHLMEDHFPDVAYTLSGTIVPEIKEFERTSTAVLNAYLQPVVEHYLLSLQTQLVERGLSSEMFLMQSSGGLITANEAAKEPIKILESGPASGAIAAAVVGARIGIDNLITFDMGGTTAKSAVIEDGQPLMTLEYELFEEPGKPGSGWPIRVPMVDIVEIGAGGGSIAWIDDENRLQVGPRSAGSEPGPVCYSRGGTSPTISDAHAVLGNLYALLGGAFSLDVEAAREAVRVKIADPLDMTIEEAAAGIIQIADAKVADLIREVTVARGRDPRQFALMCYGGAGPLEAAAVLEELRMPLAIIPPTPGTFSALGLLGADVKTHTARTILMPLKEEEPARLAAIGRELASDLYASLDRQGVERSAVALEFQVELRYKGQFHQVAVPLWLDSILAEGLDSLGEAFHSEHKRLYTYESRDEQLELVSLRASASGKVPSTPIAVLAAGVGEANALVGTRPVLFRRAAAPVETKIYSRERLGNGDRIIGPAVIEEYTSATVVPPGFAVQVDEIGNILLRRGE
jgi:N-methylhydantoinase A